MESVPKLQLPLKTDWWRALDKNKGIIKESDPLSLKTTSPDFKISNNKEVPLERNSTIDSVGQIEISGIIFPIHIETDREIYEDNCERLQCPSSRKFGKTLDDISTGFYSEEVKMAHYGLNDTGIMATAISISNMSQCSSIDLQGNKLSEYSLNTLISVLKKSPVSEVNLSSSGISKFGPAILAKWLSSSMGIKKLVLRDNQFDDVDGIKLFESVANNRSLLQLDMSQNRFCIRCADALKKLFDENDVLEVLDLSWNHLRLNTTMTIAQGLRRNNGIQRLLLNWNGFDDANAKELGVSLRENDTLQVLELDTNRITDSGFLMIMKALMKNSTLKYLRIGGNTISQSMAESVLDSLKDGDLCNSALDTLNLTNCIFRPTFKVAVDDVKKTRADFHCLFGYGDSYGKRQVRSRNEKKEVAEIFVSILKKQKISLEQLFSNLKSISSLTVTREQFREHFLEAGIPLTEKQVSLLIDYLDTNSMGDLNLSKLNEAE